MSTFSMSFIVGLAIGFGLYFFGPDVLRWWRKKRLQRLREQLAVIEARIAAEERSMQMTKKSYPSVLEANAEDLARVKFRIDELA